MKALRKSLFVWIPTMGIIAGAAEAATTSKDTKPMICPTTPNASMTVLTWTADGSSQTSAPYTLETSNYTCFRESFVAAYKPTTNDFTLMSSVPQSGGYGKRDYGIISSIEDVKLAEGSGAHIDYVPQHWTELPQCKAPSTEGTLPPWTVQLAYWDSEGTTETNCGSPLPLDATCEIGTPNCYEILQIAAAKCGKMSYLYHPYYPTDGYGMQCYSDIKNNKDLMTALKQGHHTFLIVP
jgi:hypothetical protein